MINKRIQNGDFSLKKWIKWLKYKCNQYMTCKWLTNCLNMVNAISTWHVSLPLLTKDVHLGTLTSHILPMSTERFKLLHSPYVIKLHKKKKRDRNNVVHRTRAFLQVLRMQVRKKISYPPWWSDPSKQSVPSYHFGSIWHKVQHFYGHDCNVHA